MTDQPPDPYRELLTRLEAERAKAARNAGAASLEEARWVNEGLAAGLRIAAAHAITLFEGHQARQAYLGGGQAVKHDGGPSVQECASADRVWPLEKAGE